MLGECASHRSRTTTQPTELVYLDFVETAPWNWEVKRQSAKHLFTAENGPAELVEMGIGWSHQLGFKGRIGLHSLPQAEAFYIASAAA